MPTFEAHMRVVHMETWTVEADDAREAIAKFNSCAPEVETDETGGEIVDWEIYELNGVSDG
jgi:hypothetical protein